MCIQSALTDRQPLTTLESTITSEAFQMHRIFTINELMRRIVEEFVELEPRLVLVDEWRALLQLALVMPFSSSALEILWRDACLKQLQVLPSFYSRLAAPATALESEVTTTPKLEMPLTILHENRSQRCQLQRSLVSFNTPAQSGGFSLYFELTLSPNPCWRIYPYLETLILLCFTVP